MNPRRVNFLSVCLLAIWVFRLDAEPVWTDRSLHRAGFITVNHVKLNYLDWGGTGNTLLFLHGMGDTAHVYDNFAPEFTNQFHVLGLTRRGHGESEIPETGYDTATLIEDIRQFLDALKIQRVVLAGHSFAGDELTRFAVVHPDRVIRLIYLDSAYDHSRVPKSLQFKPLHGGGLESLPAREEGGSPAGARRWISRLFGVKMGPAIYSMMEGTYSETHDYGRIKAPALAFFVIGYQKDLDKARTLPEPQRQRVEDFLKAQRKYQEQEVEHFRREIPDGRVVMLTNADHACFVDRKDEVVLQMREFLANLPPAATVRESKLADAAEKSDRATLRTLLKQHADVNAPQADGMTALHWAAYRGDFETAKLLVAAKANVSATNGYGVTPLSLVCQNGDSNVVELLLEHGAAANATLRGGETVLMTAARTGKPGAVKALLAHGADVNAKERHGQTALMWAAAGGNTEAVALLIQAGADIRATLPDSGFTPFFFAARNGRTAVVRAFLKAGIDVNEAMQPRRGGGKTPSKGTSVLILAVENGYYEFALTLLDAGADPNDQRSGFTPLHVMSWVRKPPKGEDRGMPPPPELGIISSLQFVRELVKRGADVNARLASGSGGYGKFNTKGTTPFFLASATADVPYMKLLLELGADPSIENVDHCTPLMAACGIHVGSDQATEVAGEEPEVLEAAQLLLKVGADVNAIDDNGETAMHGAALKNLPKVVQFLADHGAKVDVWNHKNKFGSTPLMLAQGYRPGNFKPSFETVEAIQRVMLAAGVSPTNNDVPTVLRNSDWEKVPTASTKRKQ